MASRIAIIGTGLLGTSIGLGLKKAKLGYEIVGHDKNSGASGKAKKLGAVDKAEWNLVNAVDGAGLVILALPLDGIRPTMEAIAPHLAPGCVVTDTASAKRQVLEWAGAILPETVSFVGGHPLIKTEGSAEPPASAALLTDCTYCLIPAANAPAEAIELMVGLVSTLGARPYFPDAVEHDNFQAAVTHLPVLMSAALMTMAARGSAARDIHRSAGATFRQATALAAGDPAASAAACGANRDAILRWLDIYNEELARWREALASEEDLEPAFRNAIEESARWLRQASEDGEPGAEATPESGADQMRRLFLGEFGMKKRK